MTLEGAQSRIWCSKIGWQTVPCSWSIDGEAALTGIAVRARGTSRVSDAVEPRLCYFYVICEFCHLVVLVRLSVPVQCVV